MLHDHDEMEKFANEKTRAPRATGRLTFNQKWFVLIASQLVALEALTYIQSIV